MSADRAAALRQKACDEGLDVIFWDGHRYFHADAEDLSEGAVGGFLRQIAAFLSNFAIRVDSVEDDFKDNGYEVTINGKRHGILNQPHLDRALVEPGFLWGISTVRTFALVNELLADTRTDERLYAFYGGNDLASIFLTPQLYEYICSQPGWRKQDYPYLPRESNDGWFGQPH